MPLDPPSAETSPAPDPLAPLAAAAAWTLGQLGQSLDGRIATASGHSHYVTGPEGLDHLHRLRALADAVVIGPGTAALDDPLLTVRRCPGRNPVRVALDPAGSLPAGLRLFQDRSAPTLTIRAAGAGAPAPAPWVETAEVPPGAAGGLDPAAVLALLRARGLARVLVEGGGRTVSAFLAAGLLDRLHVVVAPLLIGSGRAGVSLPEILTLDHALRPACVVHRLGADVLFDLDLAGAA